MMTDLTGPNPHSCIHHEEDQPDGDEAVALALKLCYALLALILAIIIAS